MPLSSPPVTARATERAAQTILNEWLKSYFTGLPHDSLIAGGPVTFPVVDLFFNQASLPDIKDRTQIHTIIVLGKRRESRFSATSMLVYCPLTISFYVRSFIGGAVGNAREFENRTVADNLKELLESQSRGDVALLGLRAFKLKAGPQPLATTGVQTRLIVAHAELHYQTPRAS